LLTREIAAETEERALVRMGMKGVGVIEIEMAMFHGRLLTEGDDAQLSRLHSDYSAERICLCHTNKVTGFALLHE
jgi:hypothetical protein